MGKVQVVYQKTANSRKWVKKSLDRTQSAIAERYKRAFLDVPHNGAFSAYGTIEKSPTCVLSWVVSPPWDASWPFFDSGVGSAASVVAGSENGLFSRVA